MSFTLYNSYTREKQRFEPLDEKRVTLYACGPTVYNPPHIGNARAAVVYDLLYRVLMRHYDNVVYVRNITDVDDKINAAAAAAGVPISEITDRYTAVYHADVEALCVLPPVVEPRATDHIEEMVEMIRTLIDGGFAYAAEGHVLFHVPSFAAYGKLSGRSREDLIAGARVEVAPFKRDPGDFVLWKPSTDGQPGWASPWGFGRPGWHLECSAMSKKHLGNTIDIHGGGNDLKFPHHENEIAQSVCAHDGQAFVRYWVHNGFVEIDSEKMSKSIGNVLLVRDLLKDFPGEAIRLALIKTRYREPLNWNDAIVSDAKSQLDRIYGALERLEHVGATDVGAHPSFNAAMDDDLNSPLAITHLMEAVADANRSTNPDEQALLKGQILASGRELGLLTMAPSEWFRGQKQDLDIDKIESLIAKRAAARKAKDWSEADRVRDELAALGVTIKDTSEGTEWRAE
ncbi:MAG: cysteine--tRNA ligase [Pseudomonadota bacterium]